MTSFEPPDQAQQSPLLYFILVSLWFVKVELKPLRQVRGPLS